jgi:hypothetical protein
MLFLALQKIVQNRQTNASCDVLKVDCCDTRRRSNAGLIPVVLLFRAA